jgi:hypothetical protein
MLPECKGVSQLFAACLAREHPIISMYEPLLNFTHLFVSLDFGIGSLLSLMEEKFCSLHDVSDSRAI